MYMLTVDRFVMADGGGGRGIIPCKKAGGIVQEGEYVREGEYVQGNVRIPLIRSVNYAKTINHFILGRN